MKDKILALRGQGKTYNEIKKELGCSKSTIAYHCGEGQKEKAKLRKAKSRTFIKQKIRSKVDTFLRSKVLNYKRRVDKKCYGLTNSRFSYDSAYDKVINTKTCYLTGRPIDIYNTRSYNLDHVIPTAKGGRNDLKNMGVACRDANMAKTDMTVNEFILLCKDVLVNFGYRVEK